MTKGDQIRLVKPMGILTNVGEVYEVTSVTQDGVISFRFGRNKAHFCCMSYNEFEKYFKLENKHKVRWTEWTKCDFWYDNLDGERVQAFVEYRTNKKKVQLRCASLEDDKFIKTEATCSKDDTFVLDTGIDIAWKRLLVKLFQQELEQYIDSI